MDVRLQAKSEAGKRLSDAEAIWKKAGSLDPENSEINRYIKRTETEISHVEELTYDYR